MTNTIQPLSPTPLPVETAAPPAAAAAGAAAAGAAAASPSAQTDSVTLSAAAQTSTQLLGAARAADGINHTAVAQIRSALQAGTYSVTPENLAQAIATVLKGSK